MQELDKNILNIIKYRFPEIHSQEFISNYKPSNIITKINNIKYLVFNPIGRKATIWFTYYEDELLCILNIIGTNNYYKINNLFDKELVYNNCLIFGYLLTKNNKKIFSFDKILNYNNFFKNNSLYNQNLTKQFELKLNYFNYILNKINHTNNSNNIVFSIPIIIDNEKIKYLFNKSADLNDSNYLNLSKYNFNNISNLYHIYSVSIYDKIKKFNNYKSEDLEKIINISYPNLIDIKNVNKNNNVNKNILNEVNLKIKAGLNQDEYNIIVNNEYYSNLLISSYKLSVYMNNFFRNIKENKNLDYLEESDDEEEFNDDSENKYTNMEKSLIFKCAFNKKFKKWIPIELSDNNSCSSINELKNIENNL